MSDDLTMAQRRGDVRIDHLVIAGMIEKGARVLDIGCGDGPSCTCWAINWVLTGVALNSPRGGERERGAWPCGGAGRWRHGSRLLPG